MNEIYDVLLDRFLDGSMTPEEMERMSAMEEADPELRRVREAMENLHQSLSGLDEDMPPLPEEASRAWRERLRELPEAEETPNRKRRSIPWRTLSTLAAALLIVLGTVLARPYLPERRMLLTENTPFPAPASTAAPRLYAAGGGDSNSMTAAYESDAEYEVYDGAMIYEDALEDAVTPAMGLMAADTYAAEKGTLNGEAEEGSRIICTGTLSLSTQDFDTSMDLLKSLIQDLGGTLVSSSVYQNSTGLRHGNMSCRIPAQQFDAFFSASAQAGRITYQDQQAEDVTESYRDLSTRLETQKALMERLQKLITQAADLSDLLELEDKIAETQYQIDICQETLNRVDRRVRESAITLSLQEETAGERVTSRNLGLEDRLSSAAGSGWSRFTDFLEDVLVFLVWAWPFLLALAVCLILLLLLLRRRHRRRKKP